MTLSLKLAEASGAVPDSGEGKPPAAKDLIRSGQPLYK